MAMSRPLAPAPSRRATHPDAAAARPGRLTLALTAALLLLVPVLPSARLTPTADAAVSISGVKVVAISSAAFRVTLKSLGSGWKYTLYASTDKERVAYAHLRSAPYKASSSKPDVTVRKLPYSTKVYWYRLQATKGSSHHTSDFFSVGLRPAAPTALHAAEALRGAAVLTWRGTAATYQVQQATNAAFSSGVRRYTLSGREHQLTPYGLTAGKRYWFRVRGANASSTGKYSGSAQVNAAAREQAVRAMSFNLLNLDYDGTKSSGGAKITPWSQRRVAAARYISSAAPGVIGVQEGGAYTGPVRGPRQVDSLVSALGGRYALARTEIPPNEPGYYRIGSYVLYQPASYATVGAGGRIDLGATSGGNHKWAAYQVLRHRASGTTFLFVSAHLLSGGAGGDRIRQQETETLTRQAWAYASSHGNLPVVYAGDFNSHEKHALDGPAVAMRAVGAADAHLVAQEKTNAKYNSSNLYQRTPPAYGLTMDHLYTSPGVGTRGFGQVLQLSGGKFKGVIPSDHNPVYADLLVPR